MMSHQTALGLSLVVDIVVPCPGSRRIEGMESFDPFPAAVQPRIRQHPSAC
jgi:hypothetical protein